jgi:hypothetical protein
VELGNAGGESGANALELGEPALGHEALEGSVVEALEDAPAARVGSRLERRLAGEVEEAAHLSQCPGDAQPVKAFHISQDSKEHAATQQPVRGTSRSGLRAMCRQRR